jgi:hypothetical protein
MFPFNVADDAIWFRIGFVLPPSEANKLSDRDQTDIAAVREPSPGP